MEPNMSIRLDRQFALKSEANNPNAQFLLWSESIALGLEHLGKRHVKYEI
jgi:hypothetical protein